MALIVLGTLAGYPAVSSIGLGVLLILVGLILSRIGPRRWSTAEATSDGVRINAIEWWRSPGTFLAIGLLATVTGGAIAVFDRTARSGVLFPFVVIGVPVVVVICTMVMRSRRPVLISNSQIIAPDRGAIPISELGYKLFTPSLGGSPSVQIFNKATPAKVSYIPRAVYMVDCNSVLSTLDALTAPDTAQPYTPSQLLAMMARRAEGSSGLPVGATVQVAI